MSVVFKKADSLKSTQLRHRRVPESNNPAHREIVFGNYRIIYKVMEKAVFILCVALSRATESGAGINLIKKKDLT